MFESSKFVEPPSPVSLKIAVNPETTVSQGRDTKGLSAERPL
jgi:hypothetical protein